MSVMYRITFKGELIEGFDAERVRSDAARKLKASEQQVNRLFSGKRAILKKNLSDLDAARYAASLEKIGMHVVVEPDPEVVSPASLPDMDKTLLVSAKTAGHIVDELGAVPMMPEGETDKTMLVSPSRVDRIISSAKEEADKTLLVSPSSVDKIIQGMALDNDKTMIVSPATVSRVITSQQLESSVQSSNEGRAQYADPLGSFDMNLSEKLLDSQQTTESSAEKHTEYDPEKTEIANPDLVSSYLDSSAPLPAPPLPQVDSVASDIDAESRSLMVCPACGEEQPRRINCRNCGVEMASAAVTQFDMSPPEPALQIETPVEAPQRELITPVRIEAATQEQTVAPAVSVNGLMQVLKYLVGIAALIGLTWGLYNALL